MIKRRKRRGNNFGGHFKSSGGPQFIGNSIKGNVCLGHTDHWQDPIDNDSPDTFQYALRSLAYNEMNFRHHDTTNRAHANTCGWIIRHPSYIDWLEQSSGIFWVKGKPGSGKSTLMGFLYRDLERRPVYKDSINLAFFLHGRGGQLQKSRLGMFRSLLHQLLLKAPGAGTAFQRSYEEKFYSQGEPGTNWEWHISEIFGFLLTALKHVLKRQSVSIFVDALDEADDGTTDRDTSWQIVEDFHKLNDTLYLPRSRLKICFSCRHFPVIASNPRWEVWLEKENHGDISNYVHDKLSEDLFSAKPEDQDLTEWKTTIIRRAQGVFQWAAIVVGMVIRYHAEGKRSKIPQMLMNVPKGLTEVYKHILKNLIATEDCSQTLRLMRWVYFSERPLTLTEFCFAMCIPENETFDSGISLEHLDLPTQEEMRRQVVSVSGGLVELKEHENEKILQFIHQSVKDYLLEGGLKALDRINKTNIYGFGHHQLSVICATYFGMTGMSTSLPKHLTLHGVTIQFPFSHYVVDYWLTHAKKAMAHGVSQDYLLRFIQRYPHMANCLPHGHSLRYTDRFDDPYITRGVYLWGDFCDLPMLHFASAADLSTVVIGLLKMNHKVDRVDGHNNTALHQACRFGHVRIVEILLNANAETESENDRGYTPLAEAIEDEQREIVEMLVLRGASINKLVPNVGTPIYIAAKSVYASIVQLLLDNKADSNAQRNERCSALQVAASKGYVHIVQLLLDNKAHINTQRDELAIALQVAVKGGHEHVVRLLLKKNANIDSRGIFGSALQVAASGGHEHLVQLLLKNKADVNAQRGGALKVAVMYGNASIVQMLLNNGADVNIQGGNYGNALQDAAFMGFGHVLRLLLGAKNQLNILHPYFTLSDAVRTQDVSAKAKFLLDRADEIRIFHGNVDEGHEDVVRLALDRGMRTDFPCGSRGYAIHIAARSEKMDILSLLVERSRSDVHLKDKESRTALGIAAMQGHVHAVKYLLKHGADPFTVDINNMTPLMLAMEGPGREKNLAVEVIKKHISNIPPFTEDKMSTASLETIAAYFPGPTKDPTKISDSLIAQIRHRIDLKLAVAKAIPQSCSPTELVHTVTLMLWILVHPIMSSPIGNRIAFHNAFPIPFLHQQSQNQAPLQPNSEHTTPQNTKTYSHIILSHCSFYFSSPNDLSQIITECAKWSDKICFAEWSLQAQEIEMLPHLLSVLLQATHFDRNKEGNGNVRCIRSPERVKEVFLQTGWKVEKERLKGVESGVRDGEWEVGNVRRWLKGKVEGKGGGEMELGLKAMYDAMETSVQNVEGGVKCVRSMDVWAAVFVRDRGVGEGN
ncbi:hypothetical protein CJF31_00010536 [Rutstroemia sp. NJR-2017a BVV2]|nr:hypothetical protein CJF31_00010536 [Rutstroemia sp. NJR-2017a BVV2]